MSKLKLSSVKVHENVYRIIADVSLEDKEFEGHTRWLTVDFSLAKSTKDLAEIERLALMKAEQILREALE